MKPPIRDRNGILKATVFQLHAINRSFCSSPVSVFNSYNQPSKLEIIAFHGSWETASIEKTDISVWNVCDETPVSAASSEEVVLCGEAPSG